jgi:hypothetical protein
LIEALGLLIIPSWIEFFLIGLGESIVLNLIVNICCPNQHLYFFAFQSEAIIHLILFTIIFAAFEKIKKEGFILQYTHSKTKKVLTSLYN